MMVLAGWTISVSFRISLREHWTPTLSRQLLFKAKERTSASLVKMFYLLQLFLPDWSFFQHQAPQILTPYQLPHIPHPTQLVDPSLLQERQGLLKCVCFQKLSCDHHLFWIFPPKLSSSSCWDCCVFLCYALELQPQIASTHHPQR